MKQLIPYKGELDLWCYGCGRDGGKWLVIAPHDEWPSRGLAVHPVPLRGLLIVAQPQPVLSDISDTNNSRLPI